MNHKRWISMAAALLLAGPASMAWSQIYKVTDDKNGVVFTDSPNRRDSTANQNVEEIELKELNTIAPVQARPDAEVPDSPGASEAVAEPTVSITEPANESTVAMGPGNFAVSASATPELARGERFLLLMDGAPQGEPQSSGNWFMEGILRGPHDLVVQRVTTRGKVIASSESVRIYVLRPSLIGR